MLQKNYIIVKNVQNILFFVKQFLVSYNIISNNFKLILPNNIHSKILKNRKLLNYISNSCFMYWSKLIFRGKGYRIRKFKKKGKLTLNFGLSHWTKLGYKSESITIKKFKRQLYLCFFFSSIVQKEFEKTVKQIKLTNRYTKRGLRFKKQKIQRRFGKISQVVSSLH